MKNGIMNKIKWFVVSILVLLVAGMVVLGFAGFNNTLDFADSYEVNITIEIVNDDSKEILKDTADKYLEQKGVEVSSYQIARNGIIYKMDNDPTAKVSDLQTVITTALDANEATSDNVVEVKVNKVYALGEIMQPATILLAFGIAIVAIFLYMLIMNKLASAVAVICSSLVSILAFISLMAITRIQALPFIEVAAMFAGILGAILSVSTVGKYKYMLKNTTEKTSAKEIADKVAILEGKKYLITLIGVIIAGFAVFAFLKPYLMIIGGQIALAGVAAVFSAFFTTPLLWTAIKGSKKLK